MSWAEEEQLRYGDLPQTIDAAITKFQATRVVQDLRDAHALFVRIHTNGFVRRILAGQKMPQEFPMLEYEMKFDVRPAKRNSAEEPDMKEYLNAFKFPPTKNARFIKDQLYVSADGTNRFWGKGKEESLVVIERDDKSYVKLKNQPMRLPHVAGASMITKRTEDRHEATMDEILKRIETATLAGARYQGCIRKEKADAYVMDIQHGRVYTFTFSRATIDDAIQRQVEIEYAGYIPGLNGHEPENERQLVTDMVALANHMKTHYNTVPVMPGWNVTLTPTHERKYDFVREHTHSVNGSSASNKRSSPTPTTMEA